LASFPLTSDRPKKGVVNKENMVMDKLLTAASNTSGRSNLSSPKEISPKYLEEISGGVNKWTGFHGQIAK
jgi:hypothetical protein